MRPSRFNRLLEKSSHDQNGFLPLGHNLLEVLARGVEFLLGLGTGITECFQMLGDLLGRGAFILQGRAQLAGRAAKFGFGLIAATTTAAATSCAATALTASTTPPAHSTGHDIALGLHYFFEFRLEHVPLVIV